MGKARSPETGEARSAEPGARHYGLRATGFELGDWDWRIIVSVNGSTDGTVERAREVRSTEYGVRVEVVECPVEGKGAAVKWAAKDAMRGLVRKSDLSESPRESRSTDHRTPAGPPDLFPEGFVFGFIDADLSADPDAIPEMVEKIINGEADVVIASRWLQLKTTNRAFFRNATSWIFNLFAHALLGIKEKDAQCGLKVMNRRATELLINCQEDGWFLDIEFLSLASRQGLRIFEVPVPWTEFRYPDRKSQIRHLRDGWGALMAMLRIRRRERREVR